MQWTTRDTKIHDQRAFCLVTKLCMNRNFKQSPINVDLVLKRALASLLLLLALAAPLLAFLWPPLGPHPFPPPPPTSAGAAPRG